MDGGHSLLLVLDPTALVAETNQLPDDRLHLVRQPVPLRGWVRIPSSSSTARAVLVVAIVRCRRRRLVESLAGNHGGRLRVARSWGAFERVAATGPAFAAGFELRALLAFFCNASL